MNKKVLVVVGIIFLILIGLAGYLASLSGSGEEQENAQAQDTLDAISNQMVVSPINSYDYDTIWYGSTDGGIFWYDLNAESETEYSVEKTVSTKFQEIYWPPAGNDFIAKSDAADEIAFEFYSYADKKFSFLPNNIRALDWMPDGKRVAMIWQGGDGKVSLVVSNSDATNYRVVRHLPDWPDLQIKVSPAGDTALLYRGTVAGDLNKIYLFNLGSGEYSEIVNQGVNVGAMWSPQGDKFVYIQKKDSANRLFLYDMAAKSSTDLMVDSLISKSRFDADGKKLFAGVISGSGKESIVEIDLASNQKDVVKELPEGFNITSIISLGQKLAFVNQNDGRLYLLQ